MDRIRLIDIVYLLKEHNCDYRWLEIPHIGGAGTDLLGLTDAVNGFTTTKKYDTFLEDVKKYPNTLFHIFVNWEDNENPIWFNDMIRYKITYKLT
jgi:hypothetical protein